MFFGPDKLRESAEDIMKDIHFCQMESRIKYLCL